APADAAIRLSTSATAALATPVPLFLVDSPYRIARLLGARVGPEDTIGPEKGYIQRQPRGSSRRDPMQVVDAIADILKREGVEYLSTYPTTPVIDAAAAAGIRPVLCRQERVGVGIADGYSRTTNGRRIGVFAMQYGPGAENAFPGVATAYSDSVPVLVLPL